MSHKQATIGASCNQAIVVGELVAIPTVRSLPSGGVVHSFSLTVRADGEPTRSVPVTWFDPPKRVASWQPGEMVIATGPVVRRFYRSGGATGSRTEVTVDRAELVRRRAGARRVFAAAVEDLEARLAELAG